MFIVRNSNHINFDLKRNWSSWNFGQEGLNCSEEQLDAWKQEAIDNDLPLSISGFELWGDEITSARIEQLYPGYWVLVDETKGAGLSCNILKASNLQSAIATVTGHGFSVEMGEGDMVDCSNAKVVWSSKDGYTHILEVK